MTSSLAAERHVDRPILARFRMTLSNLIWLLCGTLLPSFLLCWSAVWVVRRWAIRWQLVDRPGARKVHTSPTPMGGGLAIWFGVVACFAVGQLVLWLYAMGGGMARLTDIGHPGLCASASRRPVAPIHRAVGAVGWRHRSDGRRFDGRSPWSGVAVAVGRFSSPWRRSAWSGRAGD